MQEPVFDHTVYAVPALDAGTASLARELNVLPAYGGEHTSNYGTCNALHSLGERCYLEVLAPVAGGNERPPFARSVAALPEGDILTFAMASSDLAAVADRATKAGLATRAGKANSRMTLEGHTLRWQGLHLDSEANLGLVPVLIDWLDSEHSASTSSAGAALVDIFVTHPQPEGLRAISAALGIGIGVHAANRPAIVVMLGDRTTRFMLLGTGHGLGLWRRFEAMDACRRQPWAEVRIAPSGACGPTLGRPCSLPALRAGAWPCRH